MDFTAGIVLFFVIIILVVVIRKKKVDSNTLQDWANFLTVSSAIAVVIWALLAGAWYLINLVQLASSQPIAIPTMNQITATSAAVTLTDSIPLSTSTWTPPPSEIPFNTPSPTLTFTSTPLALENYGGLVHNCISDRYWALQPGTNIQLANGCFLLSDWGIYADYRKLNIILPSQDVRDNLVRDLFLPVSGNVDISFTVTVNQFKGSGGTHAAPLFSIGICDQRAAEKKGNFILYSYRDDGSILWGIVSDSFDRFEKNYRYTLGTAQDFVIQIRSYDLTIYEGTSTSPIWSKTVTPEDLTAFCVSYTLPTLGELTATIDNFLVENK